MFRKLFLYGRNNKKPRFSTFQAKSIDFYGTAETDEAACVRSAAADELPGRVDYNT